MSSQNEFLANNIDKNGLKMTTHSRNFVETVSEHIAQENRCLQDICLSRAFLKGLVVSKTVFSAVL